VRRLAFWTLVKIAGAGWILNGSENSLPLYVISGHSGNSVVSCYELVTVRPGLTMANVTPRGMDILSGNKMAPFIICGHR
jgi:hypothetical protein